MSLVTTKEAAQILGVTAVRARQLIKEKRLPERSVRALELRGVLVVAATGTRTRVAGVGKRRHTIPASGYKRCIPKALPAPPPARPPPSPTRHLRQARTAGSPRPPPARKSCSPRLVPPATPHYAALSTPASACRSAPS